MLAELENLFALQDKNYREFHARLMPNIEKERIIGIRVPVLRKYAKELARGSRLFLSVMSLPQASGQLVSRRLRRKILSSSLVPDLPEFVLCSARC